MSLHELDPTSVSVECQSKTAGPSLLSYLQQSLTPSLNFQGACMAASMLKSQPLSLDGAV
jgi:hypothetical protein